MGKMKNNLFLKTALFTGLFVITTAQAEDMFINCASKTASPEQCAALYNEQNFLPTNPNQALQEMAPESTDADVFVNATANADYQVPGMDYALPQEQVIFRDTAAPLSISQPVDEMEELGSEYAFYKTAQGGLVVERDVTQEQDDNGATVQTTRTTETTVTPPYVEMPSISAHQRVANMDYGDHMQDWEANSGDSLRTLLVDWGQKSGWTVVWKLDRDYILEAGVVFRGTFTEVASAIIRTFARALPAPIGTFYKGNRVLVISTQEDDNA